MTAKICPHCSLGFDTENNTKVFCSKKCYHKFRWKNKFLSEKIECPVCKRLFFPKLKCQKFCCTKCGHDAQRKYFTIPDYLDNASRIIDKNIGYVRIYVGKSYPGANNRGYAYEHRVLMEAHLGRFLENLEHVHHKNHCRWDNRIENLEVLDNREHAKLTAEELRQGYEIASCAVKTPPEVIKLIAKFERFKKTRKKRVCKKCKTNEVIKGSLCCADCRQPVILKRPPKDELEKLIWAVPSTKIAIKYSASDKAVEKWCKLYGLTKPSRGYWTKLKSNAV